MKRIYAVYDLVSLMIVSSVLFLEVADGPAIRSFQDAVTDPKSPFGRHPADFNLMCLGVMEPNGRLVPEVADGITIPRVVATGVYFIPEASA